VIWTIIKKNRWKPNKSTNWFYFIFLLKIGTTCNTFFKKKLWPFDLGCNFIPNNNNNNNKSNDTTTIFLQILFLHNFSHIRCGLPSHKSHLCERVVSPLKKVPVRDKTKTCPGLLFCLINVLLESSCLAALILPIVCGHFFFFFFSFFFFFWGMWSFHSPRILYHSYDIVMICPN